MNNDLKFTLRFDAENKQFIGQVKQAGTAVNQLGGDAGKTQGKLSGLSRESDKLTGEMGSLKNQVLGLAGGFSALFAAQQAKDSLAQYQDIRTQITALVGGQQEWIETEQYLNQVSEDHNKTLIAMAGNYARLASLQEAGLLTQNQVRDIFEGMSNVQSQTGATTDQLGNSMYGLSQALASPIVRAEELNQVVEPMPGLLNKLDKAAGLASGGFRQMIVDGQVTSQFFKETLIKALQDYDGAAARTADNVSAKSAEMARAYQQAVVAFEQPISDSFTVFAESSAGALTLLAENADLVTTIVGVSMSAAMGRGAVAVQAYTATKIRNLNVVRETAQANLAEAQTNLRGTQAVVSRLQVEIKYFEALQLSNNQKFRAIGAETQLTAARARLKVATDNMAAAQTRLNVASRAGSTVLGMLGGPAGIAMMAAGALSYFAFSARSAERDSEDLENRVLTLLGKFEQLNQAELGKAIDEQKNKVKELREEYLKVSSAPAPDQSLWQKVTETNSEMRERQIAEAKEAAKQVTEVQSELSKAEGHLSELQEKLTLSKNRLNSSGSGKPDSDTPEDDKLLESANRMLANLQRQNALYGKTTHAAKLKYDLEHGSLKGINEELAKKLMLEAQSLDNKEASKKAAKDNSVIDAFYEESDQLQTAWLQRLSIVADMENKAGIEEKFAYERRQEALSQSFQKAYDRAVGDQELMDALEREYFGNREILRAQHEMNLTDIAKEAEDKRQAYQYQTAMNTLNFTQQQLSITTDFLKQSGEEQSAMYRALFMVQKLAAIPSMIIATEEAATKALTLGPIAGPIASAAVKTMGYASVGIVAGQAFAGQAHDGINRVPRENEGTWLLKANEMVLNPTQADNFRWMVDMMQQMKAMSLASSAAAYMSTASGGMPVTINVTGVDKSQVKATASYKNGELSVDMLINQAVEASMNALYEDADNGGRVSKRIRKG